MKSKVNFTFKLDEESKQRCCNSELCAKCKGFGCCQYTGCVLAPSDIYVLVHDFTREQRIKYLKIRLMRGDISIDHRKLKDKEMGAYVISGSILRKDKFFVSREKLLAGKGVLYLRARNKGKKIVDIVHYNWEKDGPCANWSAKKGCKFTFNKRPKGGRMLIPDPLGISCGNCEARYDEDDAAKEWLKYQDILYEVYTYFRSLNL